MKGFKKTEIGLLPEDWEVKCIEDVCSVKAGGNAPQGNQYFENGEYPFVRVQHFDGDKEYVDRWDLINRKAIEKNSLKLFPKDAIVFPKSGACIRLEKRAKLPKEMYVVSHLCVLIPNEVENNYLFYLMKKMKLGLSPNGSTLPFLNTSAIAKIKIALPSIDEQKNISGILSKIQLAIEKQEKILRNTVELKKTLMHKLFTEGFYTETQKSTIIGKIPKSWEVVELKETGDVIYGIQAAVANLTKPVGTKILTNVNIALDGQIDLTKLRYFPLTTERHFRTLLKKGDILFNWRSGSKEHVGKTALFELDGEYTHASFILRIRTNEKINNIFLFYYLTYLRMSGYFIKKQNYAVNAKFNASAVNVLPTVVPSLKEQLEIVKVIKAIDDKIEIIKRKKVISKALFSVMLHKLMTGQIRVKDLKIAS